MTGPREDTHSTESKAFHSDSHDEHKPLIPENELSSKRSSWYTLTHSPYPVYLTMMLYFAPLGMNNVTMNSLMYNKLCYIKFNNLTLCTNSDFTHGHPALQVRPWQKVAPFLDFTVMLSLATTTRMFTVKCILHHSVLLITVEKYACRCLSLLRDNYTNNEVFQTKVIIPSHILHSNLQNFCPFS